MSEVGVGPDNVVEHFLQSTAIFTALLALPFEEAVDKIDDFIKNKDKVMPSYSGPDHVKKYDEYMYDTMATDYINNVLFWIGLGFPTKTQTISNKKSDFSDFISVVLPKKEGLEETLWDSPEFAKKIQSFFSDKKSSPTEFDSVPPPPKEKLVMPDWNGPDHLKQDYSRVALKWNTSHLYWNSLFLKWYEEVYVPWCYDKAWEAGCRAEKNLISKDTGECGVWDDEYCNKGLAELLVCVLAYPLIWEIYVPLVLAFWAYLPFVLFKTWLEENINPSPPLDLPDDFSSKFVKIIDDYSLGPYEEISDQDFADGISSLNENNFEDFWIKIANSFLDLEGSENIDSLSLTDLEKFFEFLEIDWNGDLSTAVDLVKQNPSILFSGKGAFAIRYAIGLPDIDSDHILKFCDTMSMEG